MWGQLLLIPALMAGMAKEEATNLENIVQTHATADSLIQKTFSYLSDSLGMQGYIADTMWVNVMGRDIPVQAYFDRAENLEMVKNLGVIVVNSNPTDSLAVVAMEGVYFPINPDTNHVANAKEFYRRVRDLPLGVRDSDNIPQDYALVNYPNPFNPATTIRYNLKEANNVTFKIYDITGRYVCTLVDNEFQGPGIHEIEFLPAKNMASQVLIGVMTVKGAKQTTNMSFVK